MHLMMVAMAERCRDLIQKSDDTDCLLPAALHPQHLVWMCDCIEEHSEDWPQTRLHRWIGFVQCAMMANRILDLNGAKAMFNEAKVAYAQSSDDHDLVDHLSSDNCFELDLGGEG